MYPRTLFAASLTTSPNSSWTESKSPWMREIKRHSGQVMGRQWSQSRHCCPFESLLCLVKLSVDPLYSLPTSLKLEWMMPSSSCSTALTPSWTSLGAQWGLCFWISWVDSTPFSLLCLVKKLKHMHIDTPIISWIRAYIMSVPLQSCVSDTVVFSTGTPPSVLSPFLFTPYISDKSESCHLGTSPALTSIKQKN